MIAVVVSLLVAAQGSILPYRIDAGYIWMCESASIPDQVQCLAFTQGVLDGIGTGVALGAQQRRQPVAPEIICIADNLPLTNVRTRIVAFMKEYGLTDTGDSSVAIAEALKHEFPCKSD